MSNDDDCSLVQAVIIAGIQPQQFALGRTWRITIFIGFHITFFLLSVHRSGTKSSLFYYSLFTPARTLFKSGIKCWVLKLPFFYLKMMLKSDLDFLFWNSPSPFRVAAAQCKIICPEWPNWPGSLAGISERARWISK